MAVKVSQGVLEAANLNLTTVTVLEVVSNGWRFSEIRTTTTMNWDSAKEV